MKSELNSSIFAIEGVAESGKTTFIRRLDRDIFGVVSEIFDTIDVPRYNPDENSQRLESDLWFLNVETQRWRLAAELRNAMRFRAIVMDRCVISQLVHMRARFDVYGQKTSRAMLDALQINFQNCTISIPSHVFIFRSLFEPRTLSLDPYQGKAFLARVDELYASLASSLSGMNDVSHLRDSRSEELTDRVLDAIRSPIDPISLDHMMDALDLTSCVVRETA
ncbi:MAG TPA: hypothetical protein VF006_15490 [Longimicrobium sp.]